MAKVNVVGNAMVVTSGVKLDDFKTVEKYRPDKLVLMEKVGGSDEAEPVFLVTTGDYQSESFGEYGICFKNQSRDGGYAQITLEFPTDGDEPMSEDDIRELISDNYGRILLNLGKIEKRIPGELEEIRQEKSDIGGMIQFA